MVSTSIEAYILRIILRIRILIRQKFSIFTGEGEQKEQIQDVEDQDVS